MYLVPLECFFYDGLFTDCTLEVDLVHQLESFCLKGSTCLDVGLYVGAVWLAEFFYDSCDAHSTFSNKYFNIIYGRFYLKYSQN